MKLSDEIGVRKAAEQLGQENLLKQDFRSDEPLKKFLTDITEVPCRDGKLYVSPIMDCFIGYFSTAQLLTIP